MKLNKKRSISLIFTILFVIPFVNPILLRNIEAYLPEETENLNPNNPGPSKYRMGYFIVENDIMFRRDGATIEIVNVSNPNLFQNFRYYIVDNHDYLLDPRILAIQIFDDKLFIVIQYRNDYSDSNFMDIGLEIVSLARPLSPLKFSSIIFNDTSYAGNQYGNEDNFRMFYKNNLLYISLIDDVAAPDHSIRVINCTDIYHPIEIARKKYHFNEFYNYYLIDNIIYTLTTVSAERRITAYNLSDITNFTLIFEYDCSANQPYRFVGVYNYCLFVEVLNTNDLLYYSINPTTYDLTYIGKKDWSEEYMQSKLSNDLLITITSDTFIINDVTNIHLHLLLSNYQPKTKALYFDFERLELDGNKVYINCMSSNYHLTLFIIDISNPMNIVILLPDSTHLNPLPFVSLVFALSLVSMLSLLRKRK